MNGQDWGIVARALVENLVKLKGDRASLARLRRCQGRDYDEAVDAYPVFMRVLPGAARGNLHLERTCFTVASLFAGYPERPGAPANGDGGAASIPLGRALAAVATKDIHSRDAVERRFGVLLRADADALPFRLRQTLHFLASQARELDRSQLDWAQLTVDLARWAQPSHGVQKNWARQFYQDLLHSDVAETKVEEPEDDDAH